MTARWTLRPKAGFRPRPGPLVFVVMDGVALGRADDGNAVHLARTPTLDDLVSTRPWTLLKAHGTAVGMPSEGDMGNSEVGHNALGAGRVFDQGAKLVSTAVASGTIFDGAVWKGLVANCVRNATPMHFIGLLSDGNVHSHIDHLFALIRRAASEGVPRIFVHPLLDGRDVPETSALKYVDALEAVLCEIPGGRARIASGGGRMKVTMDRYGANWEVVATGWRAHVHGEGRAFASAREAIETYRSETPHLIDQDLPAFVIHDGGRPVGTIGDGHSVVFFNFRGDRAIEISRAFEEEAFAEFDRGSRPRVEYAGMMQYDGDTLVPKRFLVPPPAIDRTFGELLARGGVNQFAVAETQKFGHVTYFWNGNRTGMFDERHERYEEEPSDRAPFEERPWMKAAEVTDRVLAAVAQGWARLIRVNFANGDMVGHTGVRDAAVIAVSAVDLALGRIRGAVRRARGILLVTADHGNADEMYEWDSKRATFGRDAEGRPRAKTAHTLNPVACIIEDWGGGGPGDGAGVGVGAAAQRIGFGVASARPLVTRGPGWEIDPSVRDPGLGHMANTCLVLLGYEPVDLYLPPVVRTL